MADGYAVGDHVTVADPQWQRQIPGIVRDVLADGGLYIEGPMVRGDSRLLTYTISAEKVPEMVTEGWG